MRIAVVGGGIFGITIAFTLAKNGYEVDLFEKEQDILTHASGINQYRLHRGYHYPRSAETIETCLRGETEFRQIYGKAILDEGIEHYYCIAKYGSKVTPEQWKEMMSKYGLEYEEIDPKIVNNDKISFSAKVKENLWDPVVLKKLCWGYLNFYKVNVILNKEVAEEDLKDYDLIVVATYSNNNELLKKFPEAQKNYQYELIEKITLKLPEKFRNKSVVILDGAFMCIDPFGRTGLHAMGNVVHAIHHSTIGKKIEIPEKFKDILNKGVIKNPKITKFQKFIDSAAVYFPGIEKAEHIGSMFTIRTVLPFHDFDDSRPTIVEEISEKLITVFSGKIVSCVDAANQVLNIVNHRKNLAMAKKDIENPIEKNLQIGVIGVGRWGEQLLRVLNDLKDICEVKWCANKGNVSTQNMIKERYPNIKTTFDYRDILNDKSIDAVIIATPIKEHFSIAKAALKSGKHVFVEKPIAENINDAEELIQLAGKKILFIGYIFLYHPIYRKIKEMINEDHPQEIEMNWYKFGTFDEGIIDNLLSHDIAMMLDIFKTPSIHILECKKQKIISDIDILTLNIDIGDEKRCKIHINRAHPFKKKEIKILTKQGNLVYWIDNQLFKLNKKTNNLDLIAENREEPLKIECQNFINSIKNNKVPITNGEFGLNVIKILNSII